MKSHPTPGRTGRRDAALVICLYLLLVASAFIVAAAACQRTEPAPPEQITPPTFSLAATTTTTTQPTTTTAVTTTTTATTKRTTAKPTTSRTTTGTTAAAKHRDGMEYLGRYKITGYDACASCCGKTDGITASGTRASANRTVAMKGVAFGTRIYIDGLGEYVVEDRGVGSGVVDVFCNNHSECYALTGRYDVYIIE